jgi:hypothetical protein
VVVVDEALAEFAPPGVERVARRDRCRTVVLRSFSKAHAMAGLRAGAALGPCRLVARLAPSAGISSPALAAAGWAGLRAGARAGGARRRSDAAEAHRRPGGPPAGSPLSAAPPGPVRLDRSSEEDGAGGRRAARGAAGLRRAGSLWGDDGHIRAQLRSPEAVVRLARATARADAGARRVARRSRSSRHRLRTTASGGPAGVRAPASHCDLSVREDNSTHRRRCRVTSDILSKFGQWAFAAPLRAPTATRAPSPHHARQETRCGTPRGSSRAPAAKSRPAGRRRRREHLPPVWPRSGERRSSAASDHRARPPHRGGLALPGEVDPERVGAVLRAEPERVRGDGAQLGDQEHRTTRSRSARSDQASTAAAAARGTRTGSPPPPTAA